MEKRRREDMPLKSPNTEGKVGQSRFALPLSREPILPKGCGSAGIAGMLTFIWTSPRPGCWRMLLAEKNSGLKKNY